MKLSLWNNPRTDEDRVYFNDIDLDGFDAKRKVWAQESTNGLIEIKGNPPLFFIDDLFEYIEEELAAINHGEVVKTWAKLVELARDSNEN